jgi:hypothetical protein
MKTRTTPSIALAGFLLVLASGPAMAHHAMVAQFSTNKPITLRGTVTRLEWLNPHGLIYLDVKNSEGAVEDWIVETGPPLRMTKRGLKPSDFQSGVEVIIGGYAAKDGSRKAAGMVVTFPAREASSGEASFSLGR